MSYVRIWVHLVFSTKNRHPYLTKGIRYKVQNHIIENCKEKLIFLQAINGYTEHLHCLISLGKEQSIAKVAQLIKGESAFWINKNQLVEGTFMWQDDYYAISVSESIVAAVINYIKNQETHHDKKTFDDEVKTFHRKYKFGNMSFEESLNSDR
ncbi:IS200/IS605 family transposase [Pedobacter mucosus]|uniref:IS200/IS605 family transposase n=1 Tax=Pedobacter mucosus TaxID=2895286 RepID=UPI001EE4437C|nr:IS200/IS605 family transposase [Pedobacter mucosus]UKT63888.1 IS200/IS605 family transposase [Pedobacter mucosus]